MKNQEKLTYEAPEMEVLLVELEQGIAAASTNPGIEGFGSGTSHDSWSGDDNSF